MEHERIGKVVSGAEDVARTRDAGSRALPDPELQLARWMLHLLGAPPVDIVLPGNRVASVSGEPHRARLLIRKRSALYRLLLNPEFQFGELYMHGDVGVDGDLAKFIETMFVALRGSALARRRLPIWMRSEYWRGARDTRRDIHRHYDIGNEFYALWLDPTMTYTCAYYPTAAATLEDAQRAKLDHVARKLALQPGERVVEAGFGWGSLSLHMAKRFGVKVRAYNVSHEQTLYAREQAKREGLSSRVEFVEDDFRNIDGKYDAFVSVGMLEHVGPRNYRELGRVVDRCLVRDGRGLIHSIGRNRPSPPNAWLRKRIFPGGYAPALSEILDVFEPNGLSVLDVENLRLHYARTLDAWLENFDARLDRIRSMFDESFVRAWRLYLAASAATFRVGGHQLFQIVFARDRNNATPWTRDHLYRLHP